MLVTKADFDDARFVLLEIHSGDIPPFTLLPMARALALLRVRAQDAHASLEGSAALSAQARAASYNAQQFSSRMGTMLPASITTSLQVDYSIPSDAFAGVP